MVAIIMQCGSSYFVTGIDLTIGIQLLQFYFMLRHRGYMQMELGFCFRDRMDGAVTFSFFAVNNVLSGGILNCQ